MGINQSWRVRQERQIGGKSWVTMPALLRLLHRSLNANTNNLSLQPHVLWLRTRMQWSWTSPLPIHVKPSRSMLRRQNTRCSLALPRPYSLHPLPHRRVYLARWPPLFRLRHQSRKPLYHPDPRHILSEPASHSQRKRGQNLDLVCQRRVFSGTAWAACRGVSLNSRPPSFRRPWKDSAKRGIVRFESSKSKTSHSNSINFTTSLHSTADQPKVLLPTSLCMNPASNASRSSKTKLPHHHEPSSPRTLSRGPFSALPH